MMLKVLKELGRPRGNWRSKAWAARQGEQRGKAQTPGTVGSGHDRKLCSTGMQGTWRRPVGEPGRVSGKNHVKDLVCYAKEFGLFKVMSSHYRFLGYGMT